MEESPLIWLALCLFGVATMFLLRMAIDCVRNEEGRAKYLWLALMVFTHIAGAIMYFAFRYLPRIRQQQAASSSGSSGSYGSGSSKKRKRAPHKKPKQRGPG
ncbi:MAG: PLDc N-terminal domain-containing protein [Chloroflexota bacterium]|jgi:bacteriorhodopsin